MTALQFLKKYSGADLKYLRSKGVEIDMPEVPSGIVWRAFTSLRASCPSFEGNRDAISFAEISAYLDLQGVSDPDQRCRISSQIMTLDHEERHNGPT